MKKYLVLYITLVLYVGIKAQIPKDYIQFSKEADSLKQLGLYKKALKKYYKAFDVLGNKGYFNERFNVVILSTKLGKFEIAFENLEKIVNAFHYSDTTQLYLKVDCQKLKKNNIYRWNVIMLSIEQNIMRNNYSDFIDSLCFEEQKWMNLLTQYQNGEIDTISEKEISLKLKSIKASNYYYIKALLNCNIIPNTKDFRFQTVHNFWLLVQHQDANVDLQRSVLDEIEIYMKLNQFPKNDYAYLKDRVLINSNQKQLYGTQCYANREKGTFEIKPCHDLEGLSIRRKNMNLIPLQDYIQIMNDRYFGELNNE